jgi:hypothetical protein
VTCAGATKNSGASRSTPALSGANTRVPANVVGNGNEVAACVAVANPAPKAATMDSLANSAPLKLAAETLATAAVCVIGAVCPATLRVPLRACALVFGATLKATLPLMRPARARRERDPRRLARSRPLAAVGATHRHAAAPACRLIARPIG